MGGSGCGGGSPGRFHGHLGQSHVARFLPQEDAGSAHDPAVRVHAPPSPDRGSLPRDGDPGGVGPQSHPLRRAHGRLQPVPVRQERLGSRTPGGCRARRQGRTIHQRLPQPVRHGARRRANHDPAPLRLHAPRRQDDLRAERRTSQTDEDRPVREVLAGRRQGQERHTNKDKGIVSQAAEVAEDLVVDGLNITERVTEIEDQGYTLVPDFITPEEVARIRHAFDTEVHITEMRAIGTKTGKTWRAHNLLAKTRAVDYLFLDARIRALIEGVLGKYTQINVTTLFNVLPGETRQFLHQDDGLWPIKRPHPHFVCNALIALDDFDLDNGATHIVPYSHKWHDRPVDQNVETMRVVMKSGTMLMWEGGLWHGGGANTSNRERLGFFMSHNVAYLRPQEIQLLSVPREVVLELPEKLQRLLGYHRFGLGVDGRDPVDVLKDGIVVHPTARLAAEHRN
ncbi:MAG: hypothetical protein F4X98_19765 [Gammaproteobacteria bacterium]|nr:hypothetical protein [Gammaproteobacteria bacterium]